MAQNFLEKLLAQKGHSLFKVVANADTGKRACYFVLIPVHREKMLEDALAASGSQPFNLDEFGEIIASCWGEMADEKAKATIAARFKIDVK